MLFNSHRVGNWREQFGERRLVSGGHGWYVRDRVRCAQVPDAVQIVLDGGDHTGTREQLSESRVDEEALVVFGC